MEASITSPTSPPCVAKTTHGSVPPTATVQLPWVAECSTNDKLRILVEAQPCTPSTWPLSPARLGIRPRDLGLLNKYRLGHCGLSAKNFDISTMVYGTTVRLAGMKALVVTKQQCIYTSCIGSPRETDTTLRFTKHGFLQNLL